MAVMGYDEDEDVGAMQLLRMPGAKAPTAGRRMLSLPARPSWRDSLAPGVAAPNYGIELLPMADMSGNGGVMVPASNVLQFEANPQKPYQPQRLVATVAKSAGAAAVIANAQSLFVGAYNALVNVAPFDIAIFVPQSLDLMLKLPQATPGVLIKMMVIGSVAIPAGETVSVSCNWLGHTLH